MSLLIDEYGRPIILFDASTTKERLKGVEAYRVRNFIFINNNQYFQTIVKYFSSMWNSKYFKNFNRSKRNG